jgi:hypothetical protein
VVEPQVAFAGGRRLKRRRVPLEDEFELSAARAQRHPALGTDLDRPASFQFERG